MPGYRGDGEGDITVVLYMRMYPAPFQKDKMAVASHFVQRSVCIIRGGIGFSGTVPEREGMVSGQEN